MLAGSPGTRVPVISSSRRGDMEWCGRSQAGSIKLASAPQGGGHDNSELAPGCVRSGYHPSLVARQRMSP